MSVMRIGKNWFPCLGFYLQIGSHICGRNFGIKPQDDLLSNLLIAPKLREVFLITIQNATHNITYVITLYS
jgi:hypothetical protein